MHATRQRDARQVYKEKLLTIFMEDILSDFRDRFISVKELSIKYDLDQNYIKYFLKSELNGDYYKQIKKIAGIYGSRAFVKRLYSDKKFREEYSKKMKTSVKKSISKKMKDTIYNQKWVKKAKEASKLGHKKVRELLENNSNFRERWIENCKIGGNKTYKSKKGAYDPKNKNKRLLGAIKGLQHTTRKYVGPCDELMYNKHEVDVAKTIHYFGYNYIYEKIFHVNNQNGFISCDFIIPFKKPIIIEATYWDKVLDKCNRFNKKYNYLRDLLGNNFDFIIVVNTKTLKDKYSAHLVNFNIFTIREFNEYLNNIAGVGFEFVRSSKLSRSSNDLRVSQRV